MNKYIIKGVGIDFEFESDPMDTKIPINEMGVKGFKGMKDGNEVWIPPGILKRCMIECVDMDSIMEAMRTWANDWKWTPTLKDTLESNGYTPNTETFKSGIDKITELRDNPKSGPGRMPKIEHFMGGLYIFRTGTETFTGTWGDWIRKEAKELGITE